MDTAKKILMSFKTLFGGICKLCKFDVKLKTKSWTDKGGKDELESVKSL
jgi:hypothetical protein